MTKIYILNPKLIVPDDYQQFWVHFEWFPMQKNQVKMVPKQVFTWGGFKSPPYSMSIPEAPSCGVKEIFITLNIHIF